MPGYDGAGNFERFHDWGTDRLASIPVTASRMDEEHDGFAAGLSNAITKDGQTVATARVPFAAGISLGDGAPGSGNLAVLFASDPDTGFYKSSTTNTWHLVAGGVSVIDLFTTSVDVSVDLSVATDRFTFANDGATFTNTFTSGGIVGPVWTTRHDSANPALNDIIFKHQYQGNSNAGVATPMADFEVGLTNPITGPGVGDAFMGWGSLVSGVVQDRLILTHTAMTLYLANLLIDNGDLILTTAGSAINFNNDVFITHASQTLAFSGATSGYTFDEPIVPNVDDGATIGTLSLRWSDLFLAVGAVTTYGFGDILITHSLNTLTYTGGTLFDFTVGVVDAASYQVSGTKVIGAQGALIADALTGGSATLANCVATVNLALARMRTHGLIAT